MKYILGIDNGSQSTKVVIYDLNGNVISTGSQPLSQYELPRPGHVLHPNDDLWDSIVAATNKCIDKFNGDVNEIIGVGLCTIRCCRALLKSDGSLAYPVLSWMDIRTSHNYVHENPEVAYVTTSSGYISHRLTGEFKDTAANYVGAWPIDYETWNYIENKEEFDSFDLPRSMLFDLVMPSDKIGEITAQASKVLNIPEGLPVFATSNDKAVEALGAGLVKNDSILLSLGTYICAMMKGEGLHPNSTGFWTNFADVAHEYIYETSGIRRGMWTISWVRDLVFDHNLVDSKEIGSSFEEYLNEEAVKVPAGCEGLVTLLDFLAPPGEPHKKGVLVGLDGRHTRAHIYRSVMEAIAMTMKIHCDKMTDELEIITKRLIVTGGGSNSDLFMQIIADVYGVVTVRNVVNSCASLGSAMNVALGLGIYKDSIEASSAMVREKDEFEPNMENHALYTRIINEVYKDLFTQNDTLLKKIHEIFE